MKVSVCITSFNQVSYLAEAVESAIDQIEQPFEIIISDDCSTDESPQLIRSLEITYPNLIRGFIQERNIGIPNNKTFCVAAARGDWVLGLDGDDRILPAKIDHSLAALRRLPSAKLVFGNHYFIDKNGVRKGLWIGPDDNRPISGDLFAQVFSRAFAKNTLFRNELIHVASLERCGLYDPEMKIYEDWEFRIRFSYRHPLAYCDEPLSEYRVHDGGISTIHPSEHARYIRLLFRKNKSLLRDVRPQLRNQMLSEFLSNQSFFASQGVKQFMRQGRFFEAYKAWRAQSAFKNEIEGI